METAARFERCLALLATEEAAAGMRYARPGFASAAPEGREAPLRADVSRGYEFALATKGHARLDTPSETFDLLPGRPVLIGRGVEHAELPGPGGRAYEMFWCLVENSFARLDITSYTRPGTYRPGPAVELPGRTNLESISGIMATELEHQDWGWQQSVHHLLGYLTCLLTRRVRRGAIVRLRSQESPTISAEPHVWEVIHAALRYCEANFRRPVRVTDIAHAVGYSPNYLSHIFSTHFGRSLTDHLRDLRLNVARDLLEREDLSVAAISRAVGYADPAHFTRAFTRAIGCAPKMYRERRCGS